MKIKLCIILNIINLRESSKTSYMHNLKTNFNKFLQITKSVLSDHLLSDGNFKKYSNKPKFTDIELVTLAITSECLGIDSENLLFSKLKSEYKSDFPTLLDRSNFNRR